MLRGAYIQETSKTRDATVAFVAAPDFPWVQKAIDAPADFTEVNANLTVRPSKYMMVYSELVGQMSGQFKSVSGNFGLKVDF